MNVPHPKDPTRAHHNHDATRYPDVEVDDASEPEFTRGTFLTLAWLSSLGLPVLVLLVRLLCGYSGWITAFYPMTYGPILLVVGLVLAGTAHLLPTAPQTPRGLKWIGAAFAVWVFGNILGVGVVISDLDDFNSHPGPLSSLLPAGLEFPIAGICLLVACIAYLAMLVLIFRALHVAARENYSFE